MATKRTSLICNKFAGIRRINAQFSSNLISCSDCKNVELFNTGINGGVGIRTVKGNQSLFDELPSGENIVNIFSSSQDSNEYCFIHTETDENEKIYLYNSGSLTLKYTLTKNLGLSSGADFNENYNDLFIFSNKTQFLKLDMSESTDTSLLSLTDIDDNPITGLGLKVFDSRLWIFNKNKLWYSYKGFCTDFNTNEASNVLSAGIIEFSKDITAIYPYLGGLAVFHKDSSCIITVDSEGNFSVTDESPGGCASYDSLVFHGTDLFFYDNTKKGVFSFQQIVNGDKTLGDNVALDVQEELLNIDPLKINKIKALSVVLSDRNEVWFLIPQRNETDSTILIYDYIHREWVKRVEPTISCFNIVNNKLYSGGEKLYEEYVNSTFDGEKIKAYFYATPINLGIDNTLKILYFPPRITLDTSVYNDFFIKYIKNYDYLKRAKIKRVTTKTLKNVLYYDSGQNWDSGLYYLPGNCAAIAKLPSATFKTLEMRLYTDEANQGFCIKNIEFSKIKIKQI